jgi:hypothetical protein
MKRNLLHTLRNHLKAHAVACLLASLLGFLMVGTPVSVYAQKYISVGVGSNSYIGELSPVRTMGQLNITARFQKKLDKNLALQASVNIGRIEGEYEPGDPIQLLNTPRTPNTYFSTQINSLDLGLKWTFLKTRWANFNTAIGIGILSYTIQDQENRNLNDRPDTRLPKEDYSLRAAFVPASVGIVLFQKKDISLELEQSWNFTNTDYLDNISYLGKNTDNDHIVRRTITLRYQL